MSENRQLLTDLDFVKTNPFNLFVLIKHNKVDFVFAAYIQISPNVSKSP